MEQQLAYFDRSPGLADGYEAGVSLHSHTLHSRESALPLGRHLQRLGVAKALVRSTHSRYGDNSLESDLDRIWWTPPLTPRQALDVEVRQIENDLGLAPMVSISDHDSIDAPMQLQLLGRVGTVPISVEWTTPFQDTYFHVGIHNLSPRTATAAMAEMARFTNKPDEGALQEMFAGLHADPGCLVVLNHPFWDQTTIGADLHEEHLMRFMAAYRAWIHAVEINGLRDWRENQRTVGLSERYAIPLISGGDRHGREPNAALNLTRSETFGEFVQEIRAGISHLVLMPQYRRPLPLRIIENFKDIVSEAPDHGLGWNLWTRRVFRRCDDGEVRSLLELCGPNPPMPLRLVTAGLCLLSHRWIKPALEWAMPQTKELG